MSDATIQAVTPLNAAAAAAPVESKIKVEVIEVKGPGLVQRGWNSTKSYGIPAVKVIGLVGLGAAGMYVATQYQAVKAEATSVTV